MCAGLAFEPPAPSTYRKCWLSYAGSIVPRSSTPHAYETGDGRRPVATSGRTKPSCCLSKGLEQAIVVLHPAMTEMNVHCARMASVRDATEPWNAGKSALTKIQCQSVNLEAVLIRTEAPCKTRPGAILQTDGTRVGHHGDNDHATKDFGVCVWAGGRGGGKWVTQACLTCTGFNEGKESKGKRLIATHLAN
jgi:hypothetical protein